MSRREQELLIAALERQVSTLEKKLASAQDLLKLAQKEQADNVAGCVFEINFAAINAFSIERIVRDGAEVTNIGYFDVRGAIQQWYFMCSRETHDRLAREFAVYREEMKNAEKGDSDMSLKCDYCGNLVPHVSPFALGDVCSKCEKGVLCQKGTKGYSKKD